MNVEYRNDSEVGYGSLFFSGEALPPGPWSVSIQRGTDKYFLTGAQPAYWVGEAFFMPLQGTLSQDGSLRLALAPEQVNQLDQQEQYLVHLKGNSGAMLKGRLRIHDITYSPSGNRNCTPGAPSPTSQAPESRTAGQPAATAPPAGNDPAQAASPDQDKNRRLWRWALVAILILLCCAWYLFDPRKNDSPGEGMADNAPRAATIEEQVRAFFKGEHASPKNAHSLSLKLSPKTKSEQDAVYRLYYFAAENDEPDAMLNYAACLDPSKPQWGSIEKNAPAAWEAYIKSSEPEKAAEAMKEMRSWLQKEADIGNSQAQVWLSELP